MNREDIIRMAREAGFKDHGVAEMWGNLTAPEESIERFAALVAAAEREACAQVCEDEIKRIKPIYSVTAENCVKAIRARGEKP
jgi:hypothetical protein